MTTASPLSGRTPGRNRAQRARKAPSLSEGLHQMLTVLETERQALAGLDLDGIMGAAVEKRQLCGWLQEAPTAQIDDECRGLLDAARRLNEVNRQLRNLIAANVTARLEAITGTPALYRALPGTAVPYAYTPVRG